MHFTHALGFIKGHVSVDTHLQFIVRGPRSRSWTGSKMATEVQWTVIAVRSHVTITHHASVYLLYGGQARKHGPCLSIICVIALFLLKVTNNFL
jgi:hypothetical protein